MTLYSGDEQPLCITGEPKMEPKKATEAFYSWLETYGNFLRNDPNCFMGLPNKGFNIPGVAVTDFNKNRVEIYGEPCPYYDLAIMTAALNWDNLVVDGPESKKQSLFKRTSWAVRYWADVSEAVQRKLATGEYGQKPFQPVFNQGFPVPNFAEKAASEAFTKELLNTLKETVVFQVALAHGGEEFEMFKKSYIPTSPEGQWLAKEVASVPLVLPEGFGYGHDREERGPAIGSGNPKEAPMFSPGELAQRPGQVVGKEAPMCFVPGPGPEAEDKGLSR